MNIHIESTRKALSRPSFSSFDQRRDQPQLRPPESRNLGPSLSREELRQLVAEMLG
jgi:hypothetical protein